MKMTNEELVDILENEAEEQHCEGRHPIGYFYQMIADNFNA